MWCWVWWLSFCCQLTTINSHLREESYLNNFLVRLAYRLACVTLSILSIDAEDLSILSGNIPYTGYPKLHEKRDSCLKGYAIRENGDWFLSALDWITHLTLVSIGFISWNFKANNPFFSIMSFFWPGYFITTSERILEQWVPWGYSSESTRKISSPSLLHALFYFFLLLDALSLSWKIL